MTGMLSSAEATKVPEAPKTYASVVKNRKLLLHLLCVHVRTKERTYIDESLFHKLIDELEKAILDHQSEDIPEPKRRIIHWLQPRL